MPVPGCWVGAQAFSAAVPMMAAPQAPCAASCDSGVPARPACRQALQSGVPVMRAHVRAARAPQPERSKDREGGLDLDHGDRSPSGMACCALCACVDEQKRKL